MAQNKNVTGTVTSQSDNSPLRGVTVSIKGTRIATTTNDIGFYSIQAIKGQVLTFTFIGFATQQFTVGSNAEVNIQLVHQQQQLDEVIVSTAFGIKARKKTLGYNVQEISSAELSKGKENSFISALQGKVNGINVVSAGGAPGSGTDIVIRGISSLSPGANNQPLIVIDGMPVDNSTVNANVLPSNGTNGNQAGSRDQFGTPNRGLDINPDDIETISVLKGAGATALYGLQAANGAIIITTKKGTIGKMAVTFNTSYADDYLTKFPEIQTKYREGSNGRIGINANGTLSTPFQTNGPLITDEKVYNNFKNAFVNGSRVNNSLNIQGGNNKTTYYSSVSALNQEGDYINPDGTMKVYSPGIIDNPIYVAKFSQQKSGLFRLLGNVGFTYTIIPKLKLDYKIGADFYSDNRTRVVPG